MRIQLRGQAEELLGKSELVIITERVDDVALLGLSDAADRCHGAAERRPNRAERRTDFQEASFHLLIFENPSVSRSVPHPPTAGYRVAFSIFAGAKACDDLVRLPVAT